jgi:UDP-N-acetyl-D-glucosamine dehydrogenase
VAQRLIELGAQVRAADPYVSSHVDRRVVRVDASATEAAAADAVVLLTDHDAFDLPTLVRRSRYFLDTRHRAIGANVEDL